MALQLRHFTVAVPAASSIPPSQTPAKLRPGLFSGSRLPHHGFKIQAVSSDPLGEIGARDPTSSEIESRFGDKVLGNASTEHVILIPPHLLGLADRAITHLAPGAQPLSADEAKALLRKIVGWRLVDQGEGGLRIECEWKLKSFAAGIDLFERIAEVAEAAGHHPDLHLELGNRARVCLWSHSIGGLTENDFIVAARIDRVKTSDLIFKKNKFWA